MPIKNGQSRETDDTRQWKKKHNTICVGHHYMQTNINNVNKTWTLSQTTGGKDEPNIVFCVNRNGHHNTELWTSGYIIGQYKNLTDASVVLKTK